MEDKKPFWASKTLWGALMMIVANVCMYFKIDIGDMTEWVNAIVALLGAGLTIYGRAKAVKKIA